jgi:hypothetical protein
LIDLDFIDFAFLSDFDSVQDFDQSKTGPLRPVGSLVCSEAGLLTSVFGAFRLLSFGCSSPFELLCSEGSLARSALRCCCLFLELRHDDLRLPSAFDIRGINMPSDRKFLVWSEPWRQRGVDICSRS